MEARNALKQCAGAWMRANLIRHAFGARELPPDPMRRRRAFKLATAWLLAVGTLFPAGATSAGLVLGGLLVAACGVVTATNLCLPSEALAWWERRTSAKEPVTS